MVVASENGTHVYAVAGFGERPGGKGKGGAPSPPPPPLWYYRSNSTAFRHGRDAWFFFFFLFDSEGGRGESRRAVYGCESARGRGGRGERGGQVEWSLFPRGMTRCEGLHRDRGYTPVRRCVGYVRVYIYTRRARATKRRRRRRRDRGEFPRGFFCALRKFVWRVA